MLALPARAATRDVPIFVAPTPPAVLARLHLTSNPAPVAVEALLRMTAL